MVFFGNIGVNGFHEDRHPLADFVLVLHVLVTEDVQELHVVPELITLDDVTTTDHWDLLHSDVQEQVLLTENLHCEETVEGDGLGLQGTGMSVADVRHCSLA